MPTQIQLKTVKTVEIEPESGVQGVVDSGDLALAAEVDLAAARDVVTAGTPDAAALGILVRGLAVFARSSLGGGGGAGVAVAEEGHGESNETGCLGGECARACVCVCIRVCV